MNPLEKQLLQITQQLSPIAANYGIESTALKEHLDLYCNRQNNRFLFISNLETLTPLYICNEGLLFLGLNKSVLTNPKPGEFLKYIHKGNLNLINQNTESLLKKKNAVFKEVIKVKSAAGDWHWVYVVSQVLHVSANGSCYIISLGTNIEDMLMMQDTLLPSFKTEAKHREKTQPLPLVKLSPRENEILHLILNEQSDTKIAETLHISHHTVRTHRRSVMRKLKVKTALGLARMAMELDMAEVVE